MSVTEIDEETDEARVSREKRAAKQERAKKRRRLNKAAFGRALTPEAQAEIGDFDKPLDQWDPEELARGQIRSTSGTFKGRPPKAVDRRLVEEAIRRFQEHIREEMRVLTPTAMATVQGLLENNQVDSKGRPVVPASVRLQAATWVIEHLVGKPTQRLEADISVRLQGVLAAALVQPDEADGGIGGRLVAAIDAASWETELEEPTGDEV